MEQSVLSPDVLVKEKAVIPQNDFQTRLAPSMSEMVWLDGYELGSGINAINGNISTRFPVEVTNIIEGQYFTHEQYVNEITNESSFNNQLKISGKTSLNIGAGKISEESSYLNSVKYSKVTTTYIAYHRTKATDYDHVKDGNYKLTDDALKLISNNPQKFREIYGDYFISGVRKGALFVGMYICTAESEEAMKDFKTSVNGSYGSIFSIEGSTEFNKIAKEKNVDIQFNIEMYGITKDIPSFDKDNEGNSILNGNKIPVALAWFNENQVMIPEYAQLTHYSQLHHDFPQTIDVKPKTFVKIQNLYNLNATVKNRYNTCPGDYAKDFELDYGGIQIELISFAGEFTSNIKKVDELTDKVLELKEKLDNVFDRYDFYCEVHSMIGDEPQKGIKNPANSKTSWSYGIIQDSSPVKDVNITAVHKSYQKNRHTGHRTYTFDFEKDSEKMIIGWTINSNRNNKYWEKMNDRILTGNEMQIYVSSDFDKGIDFSAKCYYVPTELFRFNQ